MNVELTDAYREACEALGESVVRERLLTAELERLNRRVAQLEREGLSPNAPETVLSP